jgi:hypothetical protein
MSGYRLATHGLGSTFGIETPNDLRMRRPAPG